MTWFWWSIVSAVGFAALNVLDKFLLLRFAKSVIMAVRVQALFSIAIFLFGMLYFSIPFSFSAVALVAIFAGIVEVFYIYFYLQTLETSLVSYVAMVFALSPALILAGSLLLGYEPVNTQALLGIGGTIAGVYLFTYALDGPRKKKVKNNTWMILPLAVMLYGLSVLLQDRALTTLHLIEVIVWSRLGIFIGGICIVWFKEKLFPKTLFSTSASVFALSEVVYLACLFFLFQALSTGHPGLVDSVVNTQPIFVLLISGALYFFFPKVLKEDLRFYSLPLGIVAIGVTVVFLSMLP